MNIMKGDPHLVLISESLKAIAHPDRISILKLLRQQKEMTFSVGDIVDKLKLSQPEVSRHLSILKNKDVVVFNRVGSSIYYSINKKSIIYNCLENVISN